MSFLALPQNHMMENDASAEDQVVAVAPTPPDASEADVLAAWLAAGARSDVAAMRALRKEFPKWLDMQRVKSLLTGACITLSRAAMRRHQLAWAALTLGLPLLLRD